MTVLIKERACEICGIIDGKVCGKKGQFKMDLCQKHSSQMYYSGKIMDRTVFDANEFTIKDDILEITLYDIQSIETGKAIINAKYYDLVVKWKWRLGDGCVTGSIGKEKSIKLHRLITNAPAGMVVDHINHNVLDNREENLRVCTQTQNSYNTKMKSNNTSGYIGVTWNEKLNKWQSAITVNRKSIYLGVFKDINDAVTIRRKAEIKYFGEFRYKGDAV